MDEAVRQRVRQRAQHRCEYCHIPQSALPWAKFHIEHIRARQHGGTDDFDNLALASQRCNAHKGPNLSSIDPRTGEIAPLYNPRIDNWTEHFSLIMHSIVGITSVGRATVKLLNMNDPDRIQVRAETADSGETLI